MKENSRNQVGFQLQPTNVANHPKKPESRTMEFDDLLPLVGEYGIYQVILFFLLLPFCFYIAFIFMSQMFITLVPDDYQCVLPLENATIEEYNLTFTEMQVLH